MPEGAHAGGCWCACSLGCLIVVAAVAATIATGTLLEVKAFTDALKQSPRLKLGDELTQANAGGPQTLLLIGSDKRAKGAIDAERRRRTRTRCCSSGSTRTSRTRRCCRSRAT